MEHWLGAPEWLQGVGGYLRDLMGGDEFLQQEILVRFITGKTRIALSYFKLRNIFELLKKPKKRWEMHLEGSWIITLKNNKLQCVEQNTSSHKTSIENEDSD